MALNPPISVTVPPVAFKVAPELFTQIVLLLGIDTAAVARVKVAEVETLKMPRVMVKKPEGAVKLLAVISKVLPAVAPKFITILLNAVVPPVPETV